MQPVARDSIEAVWEELCDLDQKASTALVQRFSQEQQFLLVYLYAQDEQFGGQGEDASMISLALLIWKLLARSPAQHVRDTAIEKAEAKNVRFLKRMDAGPELHQLDAVARQMHSYNQGELLGFCLEILISGNEDTPELAPEDIGVRLLTLKTMIDCLDR
ncbi:MAG: hypothetical protein ACLQU4_01300 [Limisphaerales bacterium]